MTDNQCTIVIQTGPFTSPESLLRDLEAIDGAKLNVQRLGTSFRGGGVATFITVTTSNREFGPLAEALFHHTGRLKTRGGDDLVLLVDGEIRSKADMVEFRDVRCRRQISLREKPQDEIRQILQEEAG